jgi:hypothetical protein
MRSRAGYARPPRTRQVTSLPLTDGSALMTSPRKIAANRANAQRSTGPRSAAGKASSRRNGAKHGLAVPVSALPDLRQEVARLAQQIAACGESLLLQEAATHVAEAAIDVLRVRKARTHVLEELMRALDQPPPPPVEQRLPRLPSQPRQPTKREMSRAYDQGGGDAMSALWDACAVEHYQLRTKVRLLREEHQEAQQRVKQHSKQLRLNWVRLEKLERYERRALSR